MSLGINLINSLLKKVAPLLYGNYDIIFAGSGEIIELSHRAFSREIYAIGALKACEFMSSITEAGLYDMDDVIDF